MNENIKPTIIKLRIPQYYKRYVVYSMCFQRTCLALASLVLLALPRFVSESGKAGIIGGAFSLLFLGLLPFLDLSAMWFYQIDETGIRFVSQSPLYGVYTNEVIRVDWVRQTVVEVQQGEWRHLPILQIKLAPTSRIRKGDALPKAKVVNIVYNPEDEMKVISDVIPIICQHKTN